MADVKCPPCLKKRLAEIWLNCDPLSPYHVLGEVIRSVEVEGACNDSFDTTLFDTIYRYVVLFGLPEFAASEKRDISQRAIYNEDNPVWVAVTEELGYSMVGCRILHANRAYPRRRICSRSQSKSSVEQYDKDCALWSVKIGSHPVIKRYVLFVKLMCLNTIGFTAKCEVLDLKPQQYWKN